MTYPAPARRPQLRRIRWGILIALAVAIAAIAVLRSPSESSSLAESPAAGGAIPAGMTVFDDDIPGVAELDPALAEALRRATLDAVDDGVQIYVTSGWRSTTYQDRLLREAVVEYGSEEEAARWVATAEDSAHVSGDAVDVGSYDAMEWLSVNGAGYGLCQIFRDEPWHYELRPDAVARGCPAMYADPTQR